MRFQAPTQPDPTQPPSAAAVPAAASSKSKVRISKPKVPDPLAAIPDSTLAFMLFLAAGRSADMAKCSAIVPQARQQFARWLSTQPPMGDWRAAFNTFASTLRDQLRVESPKPAAPPPPSRSTPLPAAAVVSSSCSPVRPCQGGAGAMPPISANPGIPTHPWRRRLQLA